MEKRSEEAILTLLIILCSMGPAVTLLLAAGEVISVPRFIKVVLPLSLLLFLGILSYSHLQKQTGLINKVLIGIGAGIAGTLLMGIVASLGGLLGLSQGMSLGMPSLLGRLVLGYEVPGTTAKAVGYFYHYSIGISFGVIYALLFGRARWFIGVLYGLVLWFFNLVTLPLLIVGTGMGTQAILAQAGVLSLLAHIVYGAALGTVVRRYVTERSIFPVLLYGSD
jgi:hypothetical protein